MDVLTSMMDHLRSSGTLVGKSILTPPWAVRFEDTASLAIVTMLRGDAWLITGNSATGGQTSVTRRLMRGDLAVLVGGTPFSVVSDATANTPPLYVLENPTTCTDETGRALDPGDLILGARSCGSRLDGEHVLLTSIYQTTGAVSERVLTTLPSVIQLPAHRQPAPVALIESELQRDQPGQQAVLDRLLELLLVATLRDWFALPDTATPAWYHAMQDPTVGVASARYMTTPQPLGQSQPSPGKQPYRGPHSHDGSRHCLGSPPSPTSPTGDSASPPTCSATPTTQSIPSPTKLGTPPRSPSAALSFASLISGQPSTGVFTKQRNCR